MNDKNIIPPLQAKGKVDDDQVSRTQVEAKSDKNVEAEYSTRQEWQKQKCSNTELYRTICAVQEILKATLFHKLSYNLADTMRIAPTSTSLVNCFLDTGGRSGLVRDDVLNT